MALGKYIQEAALFADISLEQVQQLDAMARRVDYKAGDFIFNEKESGAEFYLIINGAVSINKNVAGGRKRNLSTLRRGDLFGELALFDAQPRSADAEVLEDAQVLVFKNSSFLEMLDRQPDFAAKIQRRIIQVLCKRLRETDNMLNEGVIWGFSMDV